MSENSRVPPRVRPRPYDLRRRVLLKNFLREQMTQFPRSSESSLDQNINSVSLEQDPPTSIGNEENIETSNAQDQVSSTTSVQESMASSSSFSGHDIADDTVSSTCETATTTERDENPPLPKPSRFSNLLRFKISSNQKKQGISKAKFKLKSKSPIKSPNVRASIKAPSESSVKDKARTFFSLFKARRNKKRRKISNGSPVTPRHSSPSTSYDNRSMSNQSVQTDTNWSNTDYRDLEQSNRSLREENRLLSESLSSVMSDFSFKLSPLKIPYGTDSYITANGTTAVPRKSEIDQSQYGNRNVRKNAIPNVKVLRSKSLYERTDRRDDRNLLRSGLRTRSMNRGYERFSESSSGESYSRFENSSTYRPKYRAFSSANDSNFDHYENSVPVHNRMNTRMAPYTSPVLKSLPINNSSRIVRRSSMPERTSRDPVRPLIRRSSTRNGDFNHNFPRYRNDSYKSRQEDHTNYSQKRRSLGSYGRQVPFQDLPREAFY